MLKSLNISNLAVIESQTAEFEEGFTVLTGETGAGKSVLIDSINMILGNRTDKTLVRHGKKAAVCEACFAINSEKVRLMLEEEGIFDFDGELFISRSLSSEGKSVCKINGVTVSAGFLKNLGAELINIHGQQDNQKLLSKKYHTDILDNYIKVNEGTEVYDKFGAAYDEYKKLGAEYEKLSKNSEETEKEIKYLSFVKQELEDAAIYEGEEAELEEKQEILANAKDIYIALSNACEILYDGEENAYDMLSSAERISGGAVGEIKELEEACESLGDCIESVKDVCKVFRRFRDNLDLDENSLREVDERLGLIMELKRKYKKNADDFEKYLLQVSDELEGLKAVDCEVVLKNMEEAKSKALDIAKKITVLRKKYKEILENQICGALCDLNMKNVRFEISLKNTELMKTGVEEAEFLICTAGKGEMRAMEKIASGGELSRIMLAIKYVLSGADDCPTLIFDEVDAGVSGVSAEAVGEKLRLLSRHKQVICITHLAQIAARATKHIRIVKEIGDDMLYSTKVEALERDERVKEIARIMGGSNISKSVLEAAVEMLGKEQEDN